MSALPPDAFDFHAPTPRQSALRRLLAVLEALPASRERSIAITKLERALAPEKPE
jgi:hypothetical protein